jgi:16S rRNA (guanine527-N7)-methyltransferase
MPTVGPAKTFSDRVLRRARRAGLAPSPALLDVLEQYVRLLGRWNAKINLTAFQLADPTDEAIDRLLIEPLVAARHLPHRKFSLIDIGAGNGSPGIPLRLAAPTATLTLVESKTRKAVFLSEAVRHLGLSGTTVEAARFEQLLTRPELHEAFDVLSLRAVRVEPRTLLTLQAFLRPGGLVFWFTGAGTEPQEDGTFPLARTATYPLVENLRSRLVVLEKQSAGR